MITYGGNSRLRELFLNIEFPIPEEDVKTDEGQFMCTWNF